MGIQKKFTPSPLSRVSHELKTPIAGIVGLADILNQSQLTTEQQFYVAAILDCASSLQKAQIHIKALLNNLFSELPHE